MKKSILPILFLSTAALALTEDPSPIGTRMFRNPEIPHVVDFGARFVKLPYYGWDRNCTSVERDLANALCDRFGHGAAPIMKTCSVATDPADGKLTMRYTCQDSALMTLNVK